MTHTIQQCLQFLWIVIFIIRRAIAFWQIMPKVNKYFGAVTGFNLCNASANLVNATMNSDSHGVFKFIHIIVKPNNSFVFCIILSIFSILVLSETVLLRLKAKISLFIRIILVGVQELWW